MLRNIARSHITRALLQPASVRRVSCTGAPGAALPRSVPHYTGLQKEHQQGGTCPHGVHHKQAYPRFRSSGAWRYMSKTVSAADAADLAQDSEVDRKQTVASNVQPLEADDRPKILCEFVTQAAFNFMSCGAVAMAKMYAGSDAAMTMGLIMAAHMVLLPMMIYTAGPISGAHFNPMVTSVFVMAKMQSLSSGVCYIIAQCLGGILGAAGAFYSLPANMQVVGFAGVQGVPLDRTVAQAFLGEVYASFFFIFILMGMVVDKRGWGKLGPLAVPLAICLDMWILGPVSSMCINPARALGPALVTGFWENHWLWWTAPFVGGLTAGKLYTKFWMPKDQLPAAAKAVSKKLL
ncbi:hypothetical protein ABBQ38_001694 [Trebouxia sp. C0009 RCD-2024]